MIAWSDSHESDGCGYDGCTMTLMDSLAVIMEMERIMCFECRTGDLVIAGEECPSHINTKCESLTAVALGQISKWYKMRTMQLSAKGHTIPFINIPGNPD